MNARCWATGSCLPIGSPHCRRSPAHSRAIFSACFADAAQIAGSDRRPVFSVASAILRPLPTPPTTASLGTKTSSKVVSEFSIPRRPMNALRVRTVMPSAS